MTTDTLIKPSQGGWLDLLKSVEITGGDVNGFHSESDVVLSHLGDGTDLQKMYAEIQSAFNLYNDNLDALVSLISAPTTLPAEMVLQSSDGDRMEKASEFGVPSAIKSEPASILGSDFIDYDIATRFSYRFLRSANVAQVRQGVDNIFLAHRKTVVASVLDRLFNNSQIATPEGNISYGLWAADGKPNSYMGTSFDAAHNHYLVSGAVGLDSEDIESLQRIVLEHGYGRTEGSQLLLLCSDADAEIIASFRAGEVSANTKVAKHSYIPSASAPTYLTDKSIVGNIAPGELSGIPVAGSYGRMWVVPHVAIPAGYVAVVASSGASNPLNPISLRSHPDPQFSGLKLLPGNWGGYPLIESFAVYAGGTGTRHRGAAAVMQIKASGSYEPPTIGI